MSGAIGAAVLAAGSATRFGSPKQLARLDGRPLLDHVLDAVAAAGPARSVVVLGSHAEEVLSTVDLHGAAPVVCEGWEEGIAASLRCAVRALHDLDGVVIVLGDQPRVSAEAIRRVAEAAGPRSIAARATYDGVPGHPVLLSKALFAAIEDLRGDAGARDLLAQVDVAEVACDGLGSAEDIDTRSDLEVVRK